MENRKTLPSGFKPIEFERFKSKIKQLKSEYQMIDLNIQHFKDERRYRSIQKVWKEEYGLDQIFHEDLAGA